jgi:vacuolar-type H+-ATPase subunit H
MKEANRHLTEARQKAREVLKRSEKKAGEEEETTQGGV